MAHRELTTEQRAKLSGVFRALGVKARFEQAVKPLLRETPEYELARSEGRARRWLDSEAVSLADALYEYTLARLEDLDP